MSMAIAADQPRPIQEEAIRLMGQYKTELDAGVKKIEEEQANFPTWRKIAILATKWLVPLALLGLMGAIALSLATFTWMPILIGVPVAIAVFVISIKLNLVASGTTLFRDSFQKAFTEAAANVFQNEHVLPEANILNSYADTIDVALKNINDEAATDPDSMEFTPQYKKLFNDIGRWQLEKTLKTTSVFIHLLTASQIQLRAGKAIKAEENEEITRHIKMAKTYIPSTDFPEGMQKTLTKIADIIPRAQKASEYAPRSEDLDVIAALIAKEEAKTPVQQSTQNPQQTQNVA